MAFTTRLAAAGLVLAGLLGSIAPVKADPRSDATVVVTKLMNDKNIDTIFETMSPLIRQAILGNMQQGEAATLSVAVKDIVIAEFLAKMRQAFGGKMRVELVQVYMAELTPGELASLRAFLETPEGSGFAEKQSSLMRRANKVGESIGRVAGNDAAMALGERLAKDGESMIADPQELATLRRMFPARK